jgi:hypothetical protein
MRNAAFERHRAKCKKEYPLRAGHEQIRLRALFGVLEVAVDFANTVFG